MKTSHISRRQALMGIAAVLTSGCGGGGASSPLSQLDSATPVATLANGAALRGRRVDTVVSFKGIPYVQNPYLPENRFLPPKPAAAWSGIRDAGEFGPMPPQPARAPTGAMGAAGDLTLNVWTPAKIGRFPVMVWMPGGAYMWVDASEPWYDGTAFARDDVVLVSVNYRVGVDGFMLVEGGAPNLGIQDQIAALQWVQQNISAFAGDPSRVTLFGESAGAHTAMTLLTLPEARGLFHQVIAESPPFDQYTAADAAAAAQITSQALGVPATREALTQVPLDALIAGVQATRESMQNASEWGPFVFQPPYLPVVDGTLLRTNLLAAVASNAPTNIPVLIGCNDEEGRLDLVPPGLIDAVTLDMANQRLADFGFGNAGAQVYSARNPGGGPGDMFANINSDRTFRIGTMRMTESLSTRGTAVWSYQLGWKSPGFGGRLGASHVIDVPLVFDQVSSPLAQMFLGNSPPQQLATEMHAAWVQFAKTGALSWPKYQISSRQVMRFNVPSMLASDPDQATRDLWSSVPL
jgi:para-nitrobenzyl esterase